MRGVSFPVPACGKRFQNLVRFLKHCNLRLLPLEEYPDCLLKS